jgi:hypothetical protein
MVHEDTDTNKGAPKVNVFSLKQKRGRCRDTVNVCVYTNSVGICQCSNAFDGFNS